MSRQVFGGDDDVVWLDHRGVVRQTEKAMLFALDSGEERWVPKSVVVDWGDDVVGVQKWWAEAHAIKGDW